MKMLPRPGATVAVCGLLVAILSATAFESGRSHAQSASAGAQPVLHGVVVTYKEGTAATDTAALPGLALHVAQGTSPTPFLPAGPFTADFEGLLSVDLRDDYQFRAELSGSARLSIGEAVVLTASGPGAPVTTTKPIRLARGPNRFKVTYTSPPSGDAFLRLFWSSPAIDWEPIPAGALSRAAGPDAGLERGQQQRTGRMLVLEYRCTRCHLVEGGAAVHMDAPGFEGIGLRRNQAWLARWIMNPRTLRPTARMPQLLHGSEAPAQAADIAAFLATRRGSQPSLPVADGDASVGEELYAAFHCATCHEGSGDPTNLHQSVSLDMVRAKFAPGALVEFLRKPDRYFASIAMPDFKLTEDEAAALAGWLESRAATPPADAPEGDAARGEVLVQERGCLACHGSTVISKVRWRAGFRRPRQPGGLGPGTTRRLTPRPTNWRVRSVRLFRPLREPIGARWLVTLPPSSPPRSLPG